MINIPEVLDEVVDYLNTLSLNLSFTATRSFVPRDSIEELKTLTVVVFPRIFTSTRHNRNTLEDEFGVSIVVTKKITANLSEMDGLLEFCSGIFNNVFEHDFTTNKFTAEQNEMSPIYDYDKISANSVFQSMISFNGRNYAEG